MPKVPDPAPNLLLIKLTGRRVDTQRIVAQLKRQYSIIHDSRNPIEDQPGYENRFLRLRLE